MTDIVKSPFRVYLVEDNEDDIFLVEKAISKSAIETELDVAYHGDSFLEQLETRLARDQSLPEIVILDISMPRLDGFQVIKSLKSDPRLRHLPVLFLTTTSRKEDVQRAFELGASSFFTKPAEFDALVRLMNCVLTYWATITRLPTGP